MKNSQFQTSDNLSNGRASLPTSLLFRFSISRWARVGMVCWHVLIFLFVGWVLLDHKLAHSMMSSLSGRVLLILLFTMPVCGIWGALMVVCKHLQVRYPIQSVMRLEKYSLVSLILSLILGVLSIFSDSVAVAVESFVALLGIFVIGVLQGVEFWRLGKLYPNERRLECGDWCGLMLLIASISGCVFLVFLMLAGGQLVAVFMNISLVVMWLGVYKFLREQTDSVYLSFDGKQSAI